MSRASGWPPRDGGWPDAVLDGDGQRELAARLLGLPPGATAEVVLVADGGALSLPVELIRLAGDADEAGPLGLLPNVSLTAARRGHPQGNSARARPGPAEDPRRGSRPG